MLFHERFGLDLGLEEARLRFINRVDIRVLGDYWYKGEEGLSNILKQIAFHLGDEQKGSTKPYYQKDFLKCLRTIEALYKSLKQQENKADLDTRIKEVFGQSEVDLGIRWEKGIFLPSGAALLDERLVNDILHWLADPKYESVSTPYEKALRHLIEVDRRPELLQDVITDSYEALEAIAKIICGNNKDLTANRQKFVSILDVSDRYKQMLKSYVEYARDFRHAPEATKSKPTPSKIEVESYIYVTGLFLRLGTETIRSGI